MLNQVWIIDLYADIYADLHLLNPFSTKPLFIPKYNTVVSG